jgi:hypothetical protein
VVAWIRWLSTDRRERVSEPTTIPDRAQQTHTPSDHSPGGGIYLAFVPWILFSLITQRDSLTAAAVVALIASILIALRSISTSGPKLLEIAAVAAFVGFAIVAVVADASATMWLERYARAIDTRRGNTIFNWVIPIILIVWAVKRTGEVSRAASEKDPRGV